MFFAVVSIVTANVCLQLPIYFRLRICHDPLLGMGEKCGNFLKNFWPPVLRPTFRLFWTRKGFLKIVIDGVLTATTKPFMVL
ncbi:hypothetical protein ASD85_25500 [Rhizobium sp. Root651]|nr:hypothetical protein ASD85_25500 [Rhizobium sp. Root651]